MNLSGTGLTNRPETDSPAGGTTSGGPAPKGLRGRLEANRRIVALAAAGLLVAAAGGAYLLLFAGSSDPLAEDTGPIAPVAGSVTAAPTPTEASASSTASSGSGGSGAASAAVSRNPFAPKPTASSSVTGTAGSTGSPETTATTVTATVTDPAVYLSLFSVASDGEAVFSVNGTTYTQSPGDTFGEGKALAYHKKVTISGETCASVSYADQTYTVCPGEMHQVD